MYQFKDKVIHKWPIVGCQIMNLSTLPLLNNNKIIHCVS